VSEDSTSADTGPVGKGRPTPKRPISRGPVAPPPLTRKEAAKRVREQNAARRQTTRSGMRAGDDDAYLLKRDKGPVRRLVRDLVDSRRTVATLLMPAAVIPIAAGLLSNDVRVQQVAQFVWVLAIMLAMADFFSGFLRIRREVSERFPEERRMRGHVFYGLMRMLQFRRLRVPKPAVSVGDTV
jgi:hypothetical protein